MDTKQDDEVGDGREDHQESADQRLPEHQLEQAVGGDFDFGGAWQVEYPPVHPLRSLDSEVRTSKPEEHSRDAEIDEHVVRQQRDRDRERQPDPALAIDVGDCGHRPDEGQDGDGAEAQNQYCHPHEVDPIVHPLGVAQGVRPLDEEDVHEDLVPHVENQAEVNAVAALSLIGKIRAVEK